MTYSNLADAGQECLPCQSQNRMMCVDTQSFRLLSKSILRLRKALLAPMLCSQILASLPSKGTTRHCKLFGPSVPRAVRDGSIAHREKPIVCETLSRLYR